MSKREGGFSLIEVVVAMAIILVGASVAIVQLRSSMAIMDADKAINLVSGQLRYARQIAVDQRRNVFVEFIGDDQLRLTRLDPASATTVMADLSLPGGFTFGKPSGVGDTPDAYGDAAPIYFNMSTNGIFQADGSFVDNTGLPANGSVFTMGNNLGSARALTLAGATGRTKVYWLQGTTWIEKK
jgi:prepilin-type N-terminal cleavage/methylation domain-containing protein